MPTIHGHIPFSGGTAVWPIFKNPAVNGAITITEAYIWSSGNGTVVSTLVNLGTGGSATSSTIGTTSGSAFASVESGGGTPVITTYTISSSYNVVGGGQWVGVAFGAGTAGTATFVDISYENGVGV